MKHKTLTWLELLLHRLFPSDVHPRVCLRCRRRIKANESWRATKIGWFAPVYCTEHKDCANPTRETAYQLARRFLATIPESSEDAEVTE